MCNYTILNETELIELFHTNVYTDERAINTTFAEGSVKVMADNQGVISKPDQQPAVINDHPKRNNVSTVDAGKVPAWKNGIFQFERTGISRRLDLPVLIKNAKIFGC